MNIIIWWYCTSDSYYFVRFATCEQRFASDTPFMSVLLFQQNFFLPTLLHGTSIAYVKQCRSLCVCVCSCICQNKLLNMIEISYSFFYRSRNINCNSFDFKLHFTQEKRVTQNHRQKVSKVFFKRQHTQAHILCGLASSTNVEHSKCVDACCAHFSHIHGVCVYQCVCAQISFTSIAFASCCATFFYVAVAIRCWTQQIYSPTDVSLYEPSLTIQLFPFCC